MQIDLKGKSEFGSGLQEALTENKKSGRVPLLVAVKAPEYIFPGRIRPHLLTMSQTLKWSAIIFGNQSLDITTFSKIEVIKT